MQNLKICKIKNIQYIAADHKIQINTISIIVIITIVKYLLNSFKK